MKLLKLVLLNTCVVVSLVFASVTAFADSVTINMYKVTKSGKGASIGMIMAFDSKYGLMLAPMLHGLPPGEHGFHVHQNPSCKNGGAAAGEHLDPANTKKHLGPYNPKGHLGDLPVLYINKKGNGVTPVLAPRLTVADIRHHALMIHAGGDNYSDTPKVNGGGGPRIACGVVK